MIVPVIIAVFALTLALILATIFLVRSLGASKHSLPVTAEWIDELSIDRYRPMMRLLDSREIKFLAAQPGSSRRIERELRIHRCQLFRAYLQCLQRDFARVCTAIRILMAQSQQDRPDLALILVRHQLMFVSGFLNMQFRLLCYRAGICGVDARGLVQTFDAMRLELRSLVPLSMAACA